MTYTVTYFSSSVPGLTAPEIIGDFTSERAAKAAARDALGVRRLADLGMIPNGQGWRYGIPGAELNNSSNAQRERAAQYSPWHTCLVCDMPITTTGTRCAECQPAQFLSVFCDLCDAADEGTQAGLEYQGWTFGRGEEFCPAPSAKNPRRQLSGRQIRALWAF